MHASARLARLATLALLLGAAGRAAAEEAPAPATREEPKTESLYVETTGVEASERPAVAQAIGAVAGVRSVAWVREGAEAKVVREVGKAPDDALLAAARRAGAESAGRVPLASTTFVFEKKLHCAGCVSAVERALLGVAGVKEADVPAERTTVVAVYDSRAVKPSDVEAALAAIKKPAKAR
jgi:copper chaperone CopZ